MGTEMAPAMAEGGERGHSSERTKLHAKGRRGGVAINHSARSHQISVISSDSASLQSMAKIYSFCPWSMACFMIE
jgi:hypothetical protein